MNASSGFSFCCSLRDCIQFPRPSNDVFPAFTVERLDTCLASNRTRRRDEQWLLTCSSCTSPSHSGRSVLRRLSSVSHVDHLTSNCTSCLNRCPVYRRPRIPFSAFCHLLGQQICFQNFRSPSSPSCSWLLRSPAKQALNERWLSRPTEFCSARLSSAVRDYEGDRPRLSRQNTPAQFFLCLPTRNPSSLRTMLPSTGRSRRAPATGATARRCVMPVNKRASHI